MKTCLSLIGAAVFALALRCVPARAAGLPNVSPEATRLIDQSCSALGSANAFSFHAEILFDQVLPSAVKVQFAGAMDFALQRPDEIAVDYRSDLGAKQVWYKGSTLTIFDPAKDMYATAAVPTTIDAMINQVAEEKHLTIPLSDLAYTDPCAPFRKKVTYGAYIGRGDVNGVECDHVALSGPQADLQLWLDRTGKPVPRKIVINYRTRPGSPEYIAVLSDWKFPGAFPASRFSPQIPKNAVKIDFLSNKETPR
ncbi:MAG TPA: DUF2092 domain-containing protein [Candidatus Binataceae bacterium]|nr:DUF2092 domain-containing protein [Candidatus Binataceae bacterium]